METAQHHKRELNMHLPICAPSKKDVETSTSFLLKTWQESAINSPQQVTLLVQCLLIRGGYQFKQLQIIMLDIKSKYTGQKQFSRKDDMQYVTASEG